MDDDDLLKRLREQIERDLAPVRPLRAPWMRALVPLGAGVTIGALVSLVAGVRPDIDVVGAWRLLGFLLLQAAFCGGLFVIVLRWSIPAMSPSLATALLYASGALLVQALISWAILGRSALSPPTGSELRIGLACLSAITLMSLAPLAAGAALLLRGLPSRLLAAFALAAFASGLTVEAVWRLHCRYSTWTHLLPFHWGAVLAALLVALIAATYAGRPRPAGA